MPKRPIAPSTLDADLERRTAAELFNYTWTLLETAGRTQEQDDLMVHAAHASRFHWAAVGTPLHAVRSEWQLARVYAVLGRGEPALHHACRCLDLCATHGIAGFDVAYAHEAPARAHGVVGDRDAVARHAEVARRAAALVADDEDRELVPADLATPPSSP